MNTMKKVCVLSLALAAGGCVSKPDVLTAVKNIVDNTNKARQESSKEHQALSVDDVKALKAVAVAADKRASELSRDLDTQIKEAKDREMKLNSVVQRVVVIGGSLAGGPVGGLIAGKLGEMVKSIGATREDFDTKLVGFRSEVASEFDEQEKEVTEIRHTTQRLEEKFAALTPSLQQKLVSLRGTFDSEIDRLKEKNRDDEQAMRTDLENLLVAKGLSQDEIQELRGMSTEELLILLAGGTAAAGAGGVAGKTGKSRSEPRVAALEDKVRELALDMKLSARASAGAGAGANSGFGANFDIRSGSDGPEDSGPSTKKA